MITKQKFNDNILKKKKKNDEIVKNFTIFLSINKYYTSESLETLKKQLNFFLKKNPLLLLLCRNTIS